MRSPRIDGTGGLVVVLFFQIGARTRHAKSAMLDVRRSGKDLLVGGRGCLQWGVMLMLMLTLMLILRKGEKGAEEVDKLSGVKEKEKEMMPRASVGMSCVVCSGWRCRFWSQENLERLLTSARTEGRTEHFQGWVRLHVGTSCLTAAVTDVCPGRLRTAKYREWRD